MSNAKLTYFLKIDGEPVRVSKTRFEQYTTYAKTRFKLQEQIEQLEHAMCAIEEEVRCKYK